MPEKLGGLSSHFRFSQLLAQGLASGWASESGPVSASGWASESGPVSASGWVSGLGHVSVSGSGVYANADADLDAKDDLDRPQMLLPEAPEFHQ